MLVFAFGNSAEGLFDIRAALQLPPRTKRKKVIAEGIIALFRQTKEFEALARKFNDEAKAKGTVSEILHRGLSIEFHRKTGRTQILFLGKSEMIIHCVFSRFSFDVTDARAIAKLLTSCWMQDALLRAAPVVDYNDEVEPCCIPWEIREAIFV